jgi:hypothetical protein
MTYDFLVDTYETERVKVLSVWSEFRDDDLATRPASGRSARAQRPRAHGASVRERGHLVPDDARHRRRRPAGWPFFDVQRSRAWIMTRRLMHTSHHRGQQIGVLRMLGRDLHSTYGPTADTGGLMQHRAPTIYAYASVDAAIAGEARGGGKSPLPGAGASPVTERP